MRIPAGTRFSRLVVLSMVGCNANHQYSYLCQCDCGNTKVIRGDDLRRGWTRSCGCLHRAIARQHIYNLNPRSARIPAGSCFGRLTVISPSERRTTRREYLYLCRCECGTTKVIRGAHLLGGKTRSCGCFQRIIARQTMLRLHQTLRNTTPSV